MGRGEEMTEINYVDKEFEINIRDSWLQHFDSLDLINIMYFIIDLKTKTNRLDEMQKRKDLDLIRTAIRGTLNKKYKRGKK